MPCGVQRKLAHSSLQVVGWGEGTKADQTFGQGTSSFLTGPPVCFLVQPSSSKNPGKS